MKKHQFEEITAALSILICLFAYSMSINWLFYIYLAKSIFDTIMAIYFGFKKAKKETLKRTQ